MKNLIYETKLPIDNPLRIAGKIYGKRLFSIICAAVFMLFVFDMILSIGYHKGFVYSQLFNISKVWLIIIYFLITITSMVITYVCAKETEPLSLDIFAFFVFFIISCFFMLVSLQMFYYSLIVINSGTIDNIIRITYFAFLSLVTLLLLFVFVIFLEDVFEKACSNFKIFSKKNRKYLYRNLNSKKIIDLISSLFTKSTIMATYGNKRFS